MARLWLQPLNRQEQTCAAYVHRGIRVLHSWRLSLEWAIFEGDTNSPPRLQEMKLQTTLLHCRKHMSSVLPHNQHASAVHSTAQQSVSNPARPAQMISVAASRLHGRVVWHRTPPHQLNLSFYQPPCQPPLLHQESPVNSHSTNTLSPPAYAIADAPMSTALVEQTDKHHEYSTADCHPNMGMPVYMPVIMMRQQYHCSGRGQTVANPTQTHGLGGNEMTHKCQSLLTSRHIRYLCRKTTDGPSVCQADDHPWQR